MNIPLKLIDTDSLSAHLRSRSVDIGNSEVLVTKFTDTEQEKDFTEPSNCNGFGRVRHFTRFGSPRWTANPLPMDPMCKALKLPRLDAIRAQVFQNASCNWRCWYCFVPYDLLSANRKHSAMLTATDMINYYLAEADRPLMIDLSGGQPDLVPEWVAWTMQELQQRDLEGKVYLWSDDNLSNDYFWRYLSEKQLNLISSFEGYGRVCCFKGFDADSFSFNTLAAPVQFDVQFELMRRLLGLGIDLYAYVTFTTPSLTGIDSAVRRFIDRLQDLHSNLPLRTVPLEIRIFSPVRDRVKSIHEQAMENQYTVMDAWQKELNNRYSRDELEMNIADVKMS